MIFFNHIGIFLQQLLNPAQSAGKIFFGYQIQKVKFHNNVSSIGTNYQKFCNVLLTPLSMGQKNHEELVAEKEKIFKNFDKNICTVEFPKKIKNFKYIINKIMKSKNNDNLKNLLKKHLKNFKPKNKYINVSKSI